MCKHCTGFTNSVLKFFEGTRSERGDFYGAFETPFTLYRFQMKTVRNHAVLAFRLH